MEQTQFRRHLAFRVFSRFRIRPSWELAVFVGLALAALGLRLWDLGGRTMHYDESLHVHYAWRFATGEGYVHSPWMHGPFQVHLAAIMFKLFADSDTTARLGYAIFGASLAALPFFMRTYLGRTGAIVTAILLALSPSLLYFSRFGRNEILMAFWAVTLLILIWQYLNEGKNRYLYLMSAVLALIFATKETSYILVGIFGVALFLLSITQIIPWILGRIRFSEMKGTPILLILLISLTLPQWSALSSLLQDQIGAVLANSDVGATEVGLPVDSGWFWSFGFLGLTFVISIAIGLWWRWKVWLVCAGIFYGIWAVFYTSAFTRCGGIFTSIWPFSSFANEFPSELGNCVDGLYSGVWQSLGYWLAQQEVARGGQPWYYHFLLTSVYEFLPLIFGLIAIVYYVRKGDLFGQMLGFWALATFLAYTVASEKMPWLLVNVSVPFILLAGKFIGELIDDIHWKRALRNGLWVLVLMTPALLVGSVFLLREYLDQGALDTWEHWGLFGGILVTLVAVGVVVKLARPGAGIRLAGLGTAALLLGFSSFVAFRASYNFDDSPVELLVYAQGSADLVDTLDTLDRGVFPVGGTEKVVEVDYELWYPFNWYVRHEQKQGILGFKCYKDEDESGYASWCNPIEETPSTTAVLLNDSHSRRDSEHLADYEKTGPFSNLLWFPEEYRRPGENRKSEGIVSQLKKDFGFIKDTVTKRNAWNDALNYFLFRNLDSDWWDSEYYTYVSNAPSS